LRRTLWGSFAAREKFVRQMRAGLLRGPVDVDGKSAVRVNISTREQQSAARRDEQHLPTIPSSRAGCSMHLSILGDEG